MSTFSKDGGVRMIGMLFKPLSLSPEDRFKAAWKMLEDFHRMREEKLSADKFRLQKSSD
jgi:hypothetical protein